MIAINQINFFKGVYHLTTNIHNIIFTLCYIIIDLLISNRLFTVLFSLLHLLKSMVSLIVATLKSVYVLYNVQLRFNKISITLRENLLCHQQLLSLDQ